MSQSNSDNWGQCLRCKWWQIEPDAAIEHQTTGLCIDEQLLPFRIRITGNGGCNRFMEGEPARAAGSSERPPVAEATR
ncbi:MAG: hypothetical protein KDA86_08845 [Planctomycetaceae bacterium]|nr:hypothetical protein [Planctomycetaceae bacterium]